MTERFDFLDPAVLLLDDFLDRIDEFRNVDFFDWTLFFDFLDLVLDTERLDFFDRNFRDTRYTIRRRPMRSAMPEPM